MAFWTGKDAVGRSLTLSARPERVVSLVPSQTELLVDLGLGTRLVGRTRYCIHPKEPLADVAAVGGTKKVDIDRIKALRPDLILAEKEENPKDLVDALAGVAPVYVTDVVSIPTAIAMCASVGALVGLAPQGQDLSARIQSAMDGVRDIAHRAGRHDRVLYLIWKKPWMAAGGETFIGSCLTHLGFLNATASASRYPELDDDSIRRLDPDRVLLSSEPYPVEDRHRLELAALLPRARIELVDGELFSWYGPRMLKMPDYWRSLFSAKNPPIQQEF